MDLYLNCKNLCIKWYHKWVLKIKSKTKIMGFLKILAKMEYQIAVNMNQTHMINTDKSQKHRASQKKKRAAQHPHVYRWTHASPYYSLLFTEFNICSIMLKKKQQQLQTGVASEEADRVTQVNGGGGEGPTDDVSSFCYSFFFFFLHLKCLLSFSLTQ